MTSQTLIANPKSQQAKVIVLKILSRHPGQDIAPLELMRQTPKGVSADAIRKAIWALVGEQRVKLNPNYSMRLLLDPAGSPNGTKRPRQKR